VTATLLLFSQVAALVNVGVVFGRLVSGRCEIGDRLLADFEQALLTRIIPPNRSRREPNIQRFISAQFVRQLVEQFALLFHRLRGGIQSGEELCFASQRVLQACLQLHRIARVCSSGQCSVRTDGR